MLFSACDVLYVAFECDVRSYFRAVMFLCFSEFVMVLIISSL